VTVAGRVRWPLLGGTMATLLASISSAGTEGLTNVAWGCTPRTSPLPLSAACPGGRRRPANVARGLFERGRAAVRKGDIAAVVDKQGIRKG